MRTPRILFLFLCSLTLFACGGGGSSDGNGSNQNGDASPTPGATVAPTAAPSASPGVTPTVTPESSAAPEPTVTPESSAAPEPTVTPESSATPEPTVTPESSATPEPTVTPELSPTPPVSSATPSPTPVATGSPTPTFTPTPAVSPPPVDLMNVIQAEDYSSFYDTTGGNQGEAYRTDDVDIALIADSTDYYVGWITPGEWLGYSSIVITEAGNYQIRARVASTTAGNQFDVLLSDESFLARGLVPNTMGWENFEVITLDTYLDAGTHTIEFHALDGEWNFDWFEIVPGGGGIQTPEPTPTPIPTTDCYQPDADGVIVMEAESVPANGWSFETAFEGYQGTGYYCERAASVAHELVFKFYVPTAGDYRLSVRNYQDGEGHEANDMWSEMNDFGQIKLFTHAVYGCEGGNTEDCGFSWNTGLDNHYGDSTNLMPGDHPNDEVPDGPYSHFVKPAGYQLDAGEHTLYLRGRSNGYCIDRLHIYPDAMLTAGDAVIARDITKSESPIGACQ